MEFHLVCSPSDFRIVLLPLPEAKGKGEVIQTIEAKDWQEAREAVDYTRLRRVRGYGWFPRNLRRVK